MSTPDFDSMSLEEQIAWMESLARRQGANTDEFTTAASVEVPEVDPNSVEDTGPGYIPYGMDTEKWEQKQREEAERKAARLASSAPVTPPATPVAPAAPPAPEPVAPAPAATSTSEMVMPDFDSMTLEEQMAWMESLARRQGANTDEFTTSASVEVPEIDPNSVEDTGPGYIPYGMDTEKWEQKQREEAERKAARLASSAPAAPVTPPAPVAPAAQQQPEPIAEPAAEDPLAWLDNLGAGSAANIPEIDLSGLGAPLETSPASLQAEDPMAWLESLSQSQPEIPSLEQFALDLNLDDVASEPVQPVSAAPSGDPLEWLESLARRQGADSEEFTTGANLDVPLPENLPQASTPGYTDYSFESSSGDPAMSLDFLDGLDDDEFVAEFDSDELENPSSWLDALAKGESFEEPATPQAAAPQTNEIMDALARNDVNPEAIESWMANLLEHGASREDTPSYDEDEDEIALEAEMPDWLIQQVGAPPPGITQTTPAVPLVDEIVEPPAVEMPDWLTDDISAQVIDFDDIFDDDDSAELDIPAAAHGVLDAAIEIDSDDPWVEAFELERKLGLDDITQIPEWYAAKLSSDAIAEADAVADPHPTPFEAVILSAANLPDGDTLPAGELQSLPDWLAGTLLTTPEAIAAPAVVADAADAVPAFELVDEAVATNDEMPDWLSMQLSEAEAVASVEGDLPDWLSAAGVDVSDVPDWLMQTLDTEESEPEAPVTPAVAAAPAVAVQPVPQQVVPVAQPASPAYVPAVASNIDVVTVLQTARTETSAGNVDVGLQHYEAVVRANTALDAVVEDLGALMKDEKHKQNPAVYRVLGDGLMRQGRLQDALDTYRKALNLL